MMFFKKRHTLLDSGILEGFTDYHCHILPGVDDGVQTLDEALRILAFYEKAGVKEVWFTPHIMEDTPNTTAHLRQCFSNLLQAYEGNMVLQLSAENMLDALFEERLEKGDLLPLGEKGNSLLVETSFFNPPINLLDILARIRTKGYYPVLAHPERYVYMDYAGYEFLKQNGIYFQLNLFSLTGAYGTDALKKARSLLKNGLYDMAGSDVHGYSFLHRHINEKDVRTKDLLKKISKIYQINI